MEKKLVAFMCEHCRRDEALKLMKDMMEELQTKHEIPIVGAIYHTLRFDTPNVIVKFVDRPKKLRGLHPDEIFNTTSVEAVIHRTLNLNPPYKGSLIDYIVETETAVAKEAAEIWKKSHCSNDEKHTIDILEFVENVLGLELSETQRILLMEFYKLHQDGVKVVYGKHGKIYIIPVEDSDECDDRGTEEDCGREP